MSKTEHGYVYFAASNIDGEQCEAIKIGFSNDPRRRVKELSTASSSTIHLVVAIPGTRADESALHEAFADHRLNGEWFAPHEDIRALIARVYHMQSYMPSWSEMKPFPRPKRSADTEAWRDTFGADNYGLAEQLVALSTRKGDSLQELLTKLSLEDDWLHPSSVAMGYGLRAAIRQGVCRSTYVLGAVRQGIREKAIV